MTIYETLIAVRAKCVGLLESSMARFQGWWGYTTTRNYSFVWCGRHELVVTDTHTVASPADLKFISECANHAEVSWLTVIEYVDSFLEDRQRIEQMAAAVSVDVDKLLMWKNPKLKAFIDRWKHLI